jgi:tripartite-type tricarboxylate transporter receptor subunit TctC
MTYLIRLVLAALVAMLATAAAAQPYPTRPIRLLVSFPPGGASDIVARLVGQPLAARLGQPVVVENRPGSNGNLAGELAARATPDGYTLLLGPSALFGINPHLYAKMPIDPLKDLLPVASLVSNELILRPIRRSGRSRTRRSRMCRSRICATSSCWRAARSRRCSTAQSAPAASITSPWSS